MAIEQLREAYRARPFRAFTLEFADGQKVRVPHPEFIGFSRSGRTVFVANDDDAVKIIDLLLVTAIQVGNGATRPRRRR